MELGLTFPLQRFLKQKALPYGTESDRRYCWDLHVITLCGRKSLLAVHCYSRYTFVCFDVSPAEWCDLTALFYEGLRESLLAAGLSEETVQAHIHRAGQAALTRTHGRREVAFLNRAWEDVLKLDLCLDMESRSQSLLDHAVNACPCRCAGCEGVLPAADRMRKSFL